jgi:hypothetical protein
MGLNKNEENGSDLEEGEIESLAHGAPEAQGDYIAERLLFFLQRKF